MKVATTSRSRSVILVWTFISISKRACPPAASPLGEPRQTASLICLFAYALLSNRNYFQVASLRPDRPPVLGASGRPVFVLSRRVFDVKRDGKFDVRLAFFPRSKEGNRLRQSVFPLRPALHIIAGVAGHEILRFRPVMEILDRESVVLH